MSLPPSHLYQFGPYRLDPAEGLLMEGNRKVPLTPKAFQTLLFLVEQQKKGGRLLISMRALGVPYSNWPALAQKMRNFLDTM
jgi:hypothetical protein